MLKAPGFIFPTNTVFIDDDIVYAKLFIANMKENLNIIPFSSVSPFLEQTNQDFIYLPNILNKPMQIKSDTIIYKNLDKQADYLKGLVSVLVVDLHMEYMTGIDFFSKIKSPFIYKILISNFVGPYYSKGINQAQNLGIADEVLDKSYNLQEELAKAIHRGYLKFFSLLTSNTYSKTCINSPLSDTLFSNFFIKIIENFRPNFIWPNQDLNTFQFENDLRGTKQTVFITTKEEISVLLNGSHAEMAPQSAIDKLKTGSFILCCSNPLALEGHEWLHHLRPAKTIEGSNSKFLYHIYEEIKYE